MLVWHIRAGESQSGNVGPTYRIRGSFQPDTLWLHQRGAPTQEHLVIDVKANGVSIFQNEDVRPRLINTNSEYVEGQEFAELDDGDVVTLNIVQRGDGVGDITVVLEAADA